MESILISIKKLLGIESNDPGFNQELIMHINSVFTILWQLGIGPVGGYFINDDTATWSSYLGARNDLNAVKTYIYLKLRLMFDPPQNSFLVDSIQKQCTELEWRLNVEVDPSLEELT